MENYFKALKVFIFAGCFLSTASAWGLEIYLKNGDKISGVILKEDERSMVVQTSEAGKINLDKSFVDLQKTYPENDQAPKIQPTVVPGVPVPQAVQWNKDLSLGYTQSGGNTKSQLGQISGSFNRKTSHDEATAKFNALYSAYNDQLDGRKFYGMLRYAYSYGANLKWYNFAKLEGDADRFQEIYYRLTPSIGTGYWFSTTDDLKAMTELGVGYQYTDYRTDIKSTGEAVLVPRFFVDKRLIGNLHLSEDFTLYPSLADISQYRMRSETDLINQITARWALKMSYIDDFDTTPLAGVKKNDYTWMTSVDYSF